MNPDVPLGGLGILILGVGIKSAASGDYAFDPELANLNLPSTTLIVIGAIIFIITFFGCCGAIRESHCMTVTYGVLLLTLLVIQVAIAAFLYYNFDENSIKTKINEQLEKNVHAYYSTNDVTAKTVVDNTQVFFECCGYESKKDYQQGMPWSCCKGNQENQTCQEKDVTWDGCRDVVFPKLKQYSERLRTFALSAAAVELIGIVFSFCLANSILNVERRGYKV
ncbi:hypothetical protein QAD02_022206 [Eretmocerus hayati]|uniref:Uncharacterized protein n=1 Tax=Eretmocerus hayati TaxID=131215 RepID=A0ACC2PVM9_9HYME|nr:hypothetical protein QAD02_022206 [Eretmocerus hayati]